MKTAFLTKPEPHAEAVRLIADKPTVTREIFDDLLPELRGRAFTITGIEDFDILQAVRDKIATLPAGADWKKLRKEIAADISPWLGEEESLRRAKLLLNHHGRAAYAATHSRVMDSMKDVFPYKMYRSSRTSKEPRAAHRALDGMIFPADHVFWKTHTPPWEFGCNCMDPIPLTAEDADEERQRDGARGEETRRVASPEQLDALSRGTLVRGPGTVMDVQTPRQKSGGDSGYEFDWRATTLPYEEIKKRWTPEVATAFEEWAGGQNIAAGGNLMNWLRGLDEGVPKNLGELALAKSRSLEPAVMARLLAAEPAHPVAQAIKLWGDDEATFTRMMEEKTSSALEWKETLETTLRKMAPVSGEPLLYRGWKFETAEEMTEFMAKWPEGFIQERAGMSASFDPGVAARPKFSGGEHSMIWVLQGNRSARDMRPAFETLDAKAHREREEEAIVPSGGVFKFAFPDASMVEWKDSDGQSRLMRVFYLREEQP